MKHNCIRKRSWLYYRNGIVAAAVLVGCFIFILWARYSLWNLLWIVPLCYAGAIVLRLYRQTHPAVRRKLLRLTPAQAGRPHEAVEFPSRDGLHLFGWYIAGRNRAVVILVHGAGSQGIALVDHAVPLLNHGYGVLLLDLRAHGRSAGDTCTGGWLEAQDVLGAAEYLQGRADVDPGQVGALGISLGAKAALWAAAQSPAIAAVAAEGPGPACLADHGERPTTLWQGAKYLVNGLVYEFLYFFSGVRPAAGLLASVGGIAPRPVLLISAGTGGEREFTRRLYYSARDPKELWGLPEAQHGAGFFTYPNLYAQKITSFFDHALKSQPRTGEAQATDADLLLCQAPVLLTT